MSKTKASGSYSDGSMESSAQSGVTSASFTAAASRADPRGTASTRGGWEPAAPLHEQAAWEASTSRPAQAAVPPSAAQYQQYQGHYASDMKPDAKTYGYASRQTENLLLPGENETLHEQASLDDTVLREAFALAMEDLVPEQECCFVAKGLCHLCGVSENHYVPVVTFCPHANANHALCREHLRSTYGVRMEDLFAGKNRPSAHHRRLRCMVCSRACPCSMCTSEKQHELSRYRRWLVSPPYGGDNTQMGTMRGGSGTPPIPAGAGWGVYSGGNNRISSNSRRVPEYLPQRPPAEAQAQYQPQRPPAGAPAQVLDVRGQGVRSRGMEETHAWEGDGRVPNGFMSSFPVDAGGNGRGRVLPSLQAQQKPPVRPSVAPKRAFKEVSSSMLSVLVNGEQGDPPTEALSGRSTDGALLDAGRASVESPSAAYVMNCAESEKSLVRLLSSLNQDMTPASSQPLDDRSSSLQMAADGRDRLASTNPQQQQARLGANEGDYSNDYAQGADSTRYQAGGSSQAQSARTKVDERHQDQAGARGRTTPPYRAPSLTAAMRSSASTSSGSRSGGVARSVEGLTAVLAQKRKADGRDIADSPPKRNSSAMVASRNGNGTPQREEKAAVNVSGVGVRGNGEKRQKLPIDERGRRAPKPGDRVKESAVKSNGKEAPTTKAPSPASGRSRRSSNGTDSILAAAAAAERTRSGKKSPRNLKTAPPPKSKTKSKDESESSRSGKMAESPRSEEEEEGDGNSDSELDTNLDYCEVCLGAGDLVCCDKCPRSFHLACLHMKESDLPEGDWQCKQCKKPSLFRSFSSAVAAEQSLLGKCLKIVECLKSHSFAKPFLTPVENVPLYSRVVKQPMDLATIETKLKTSVYIGDSTSTSMSGMKELNAKQFADDVRLMWSNCKLFNDDGSGITRAADDLSVGFERLFREAMPSPRATKQVKWEASGASNNPRVSTSVADKHLVSATHKAKPSDASTSKNSSGQQRNPAQVRAV
ncbi:hypothetical protein BBJ28_00020292 [Nothophytophthora sp. Chile5]|nr:hypothetical protein BBJ28_00020292 [Nothophytophthora sp. Chile5]